MTNPCTTASTSVPPYSPGFGLKPLLPQMFYSQQMQRLSVLLQLLLQESLMCVLTQRFNEFPLSHQHSHADQRMKSSLQ